MRTLWSCVTRNLTCSKFSSIARSCLALKKYPIRALYCDVVRLLPKRSVHPFWSWLWTACRTKSLPSEGWVRCRSLRLNRSALYPHETYSSRVVFGRAGVAGCPEGSCSSKPPAGRSPSGSLPARAASERRSPGSSSCCWSPSRWAAPAGAIVAARSARAAITRRPASTAGVPSEGAHGSADEPGAVGPTEDSSGSNSVILAADASRLAALLVRLHTPGMRTPRAYGGFHIVAGRAPQRPDWPTCSRTDSSAPAGIAAVHTLVTGTAADHDRSARGTRRRVFLVLNRRERRRDHRRLVSAPADPPPSWADRGRRRRPHRRDR